MKRELVFQHPWEKIYIEKITNDSGDTFEYLISEPNDFVIIIPFISNTNVLLLKQYKHGAQKNLWGFPAGYMLRNESPLNCAKRELLEETGYIADNWTSSAVFYENPSRCRSKYHILIADKLLKK